MPITAERPRRVRSAIVLTLMAAALLGLVGAGVRDALGDPPARGLQAILVASDQASAERLAAAAREGVGAVVLELKATAKNEAEREKEAATRIRRSDLDLYYWIEIARDPVLATKHPEWMASLQGHQEWRRLFPDAPRPREDQVVKNYPWVPILYKEAFDAHLSRVKRILRGMPTAKGIFLNDLQGAPSACGCGNILCRWTADYGPIVTATPLGRDAGRRFVAAVRKLVPHVEVIPVWTTECEERDGAKDGDCAGVGCFKGRCWTEYAARLEPVLEEVDRLGVLLPYKEFRRDLPVYGSKAGWARSALESFETILADGKTPRVRPRGLIAVLQGWDVTRAEIEAQVARAKEAGATGHVVSLLKIEQGWEPRLVNRVK